MSDHSVLGRRWVYDACGDPVYAAALASAIFASTGQAEEFFEVDGRLERRAPTMSVISSGAADADMPAVGVLRRVVEDDPTLIVTDSVELAVMRRLDGSNQLGAATLTGAWSGQPTRCRWRMHRRADAYPSLRRARASRLHSLHATRKSSSFAAYRAYRGACAGKARPPGRWAYCGAMLTMWLGSSGSLGCLRTLRTSIRGSAASLSMTCVIERHEWESRRTIHPERGPRRARRYVIPEQTPQEEAAAMSVIRFEPFRDPFRELDRLMSMAASGTRAPLGMPMDVYRDEDGSYHVEADLPGADPDSVEVTVEHGVLTIHAERTPHYGESERVVVAERPQGSFTRQLSLGEGVDTEKLTAEYADGVLHVILPASPQTQPRRVEITRAAGGSRTISGSTVEQGDAPTGSSGGGGAG